MKWAVMAWMAMAAMESGPTGTEQAQLRIYLPREIIVQQDDLRLGQIGIVRGQESIRAKAEQVELGKFSLTGQQIVLDRVSILSRLASSGIGADQVQITGAQAVLVRRDEKRIAPERIEAVARSFLGTVIGPDRFCELKVIRSPQGWALPEGSENVVLRPQMGQYQVKGTQRIIVEIVLDGKVVGRRDVVFSVRFQRRRAIATQDIPAGTFLTNLNMKIEMVDSDTAEPADWKPPYGQVVQRLIRSGESIPDSLVAPPEPVLVVKRRQMVVVRLESKLLQLSWVGEALSDGRVGELIKVKMGAQRNGRTITARVKEDGTLEPYREGMEVWAANTGS
ncbi:MAG: flagellar basal body P-ring formation protein FlgA [Sedimentisphaerales bacterium]|nr:flagellar basal body P-ring formation protein FlgA [Sedimentisphaerales bacterium]